MTPLRTVDLFCGAGGSSWGASKAGAELVAAFDAWEAAARAYSQNFPNARFFDGRLEKRDPVRLKRVLGKVDLLIASPECQSHGPARGAAPRSTASRDSAFQVLRYAAALQPRWIVVENVVGMRTWARFRSFRRRLGELGYYVREQVINSADFRVAQRRKRLFLLCDRLVEPSEIQPTATSHVSVERILAKEGVYRVSPLYSPRRAPATIERAERAMAVLGRNIPYLLVYYGSDQAGGWQPLSQTLRTVTTLDRFALVVPTADGHMMRMLQVPELKRAMGMPARFSVGEGVRREQIHLIGNAVCPPVMTAIVRSLVSR